MANTAVVNGMIVFLERDYTLNQAGAILGVSASQVRNYIYLNKILQPSYLDEKKLVLSGAQVLWFFQNKRELMARRRAERRLEIQYDDITEEFLKEAPVDNTWIEEKEQAFSAEMLAAVQADTAPIEPEDEDYYG